MAMWEEENEEWESQNSEEEDKQEDA